MFSQMVDIIPESQIGIARIQHRTPDKLACMRAAFHGETLEQRPLATLFVNGVMMMSDGYEEHRSNSTFVWKAKGKVLIAGLGIGMVLDAILKKKEVDQIVVVEKYQDVIDLVSPYFNTPKWSWICADIFNWKPAKGEKFDTIYFDIWSDICTNNLKEISTLHQRFKNYKAKEGWMGSWNCELLKYYKSKGR
jgi:spermidine synthase